MLYLYKDFYCSARVTDWIKFELITEKKNRKLRREFHHCIFISVRTYAYQCVIFRIGTYILAMAYLLCFPCGNLSTPNDNNLCVRTTCASRIYRRTRVYVKNVLYSSCSHDIMWHTIYVIYVVCIFSSRPGQNLKSILWNYWIPKLQFVWPRVATTILPITVIFIKYFFH